NTSERSRGSITIDNCDYGRYMGEIQIVKNDLAADEKVNVVGKIIAEDRPLITFIVRVANGRRAEPAKLP
ncbi:DUF871 domain-containing protein, partial [Citrobacter sp. TBCS-11]